MLNEITDSLLWRRLCQPIDPFIRPKHTWDRLSLCFSRIYSRDPLDDSRLFHQSRVEFRRYYGNFYQYRFGAHWKAENLLRVTIAL